MRCVTTMSIKDKKELMKLMSFLVMGDGSVHRNRGVGNCYFTLSASKGHEDFIDYARDIVGNITSSKVYTTPKEAPRKDLITLYTPVHPYFNVLRERIYVDSYKSIDHHSLKLLDYEALAILYMSDGCLGKWIRENGKSSYSLTINMCRLSYGDQLLLKRAIKEILDLEFNVVKTGGKYYTLRLRSKDLDKFMEGVSPYILNSFSYKLETRTINPDSLGDDIV